MSYNYETVKYTQNIEILSKLQNIISDDEIDLLDMLLILEESQIEKVKTSKNPSNAYDIITSYCFDSYSVINSCLRNKYYIDNENEVSRSIQLFKELLNKILEHCNSVNNIVVHRGDRANVEDAEYFYSFFKHNQGKVIEFPNFLSTTLEKNKIRDYNLRFKIQTSRSSQGKNIFELLDPKEKNTKFEQEILFHSNTRFRVDKVKISKEGEKVIYTAFLSEIEQNNKLQNIIVMHSDIYHEYLNIAHKPQNVTTYEKNITRENQMTIDDDND